MSKRVGKRKFSLSFFVKILYNVLDSDPYPGLHENFGDDIPDTLANAAKIPYTNGIGRCFPFGGQYPALRFVKTVYSEKGRYPYEKIHY